MIDCVDLHTHTTASDGTDSPSMLIQNAASTGLVAVAVTDHDTLSGLAEAQQAVASYVGLTLVRGVEISTKSEHGEIHILGLWVPEDAEPLEEELFRFRQNRVERGAKIVELLQQNGVSIHMEDVLQYAKGPSVGRPHIAAALVEKGYAKDITDAFAQFLVEGKKTYVPRMLMDPESAVRLLSSLGCTVILAHPMLKAYPVGWLEALVRRLLPYGLSGIEVWHSSHTVENSSQCLALARKYQLCISGGSDYHGKNKPRISLGKGFGRLCVPVTVLRDLCVWREQRGLWV